MHAPITRRMAAVAAIAALARPALANEATAWPTRPVRVITPFGAGGPVEHLRPLLAHLQAAFGQPFVLDYRPGATGAIGTAAVARSAPDGYTLLVAPNSSHVIAPLALPSPSFDPLGDFAPVGLLVTFPFYLIVHPGVPARTLAELIAHLRANPGKLTFASPGIGGGGHLMFETLKDRAGFDAVHSPYPGPAQALMAVVANEAQFAFDTVGNAQPNVAAGRVRGIAVTGRQRIQAAPDIPNFTEAGMPGFEDVDLWLGMMAPANTPPAIATALNREIGRFLAVGDAQARLRSAGFEPAGGSPEEFRARLASETRLWTGIVERAGLRAAAR